LYGEAPLGILYLSAVLEEAGHKTDLFDLTPYPSNEKICVTHGNHPVHSYSYAKVLLERISEFKPDLVAFTVISPHFFISVSLSNFIKSNYDLPILFGGHHPTADPEGTISQKPVDMICAYLDSIPVGILQGKFKKLWKFWLEFDCGTLGGSAVGILPGYDKEKMMNAFLSKLGEVDKKIVRFKFYTSEVYPSLLKHGFKMFSVDTIMLDLAGSIDKIWCRLDKNVEMGLEKLKGKEWRYIWQRIKRIWCLFTTSVWKHPNVKNFRFPLRVSM